MKTKMFDEDFSTFIPEEYLEEHFPKSSDRDIGPIYYALLRFFAQAYSDIPKNSIMLEFSGGPTIYQLISAASRVKEIHFSDYLESNLKEVNKWKENKRNLFDWTMYFREALYLDKFFGEIAIDGKNVIKNRDIVTREKMLRKKLTQFKKCNGFLPDPLGPTYRNKYDIVASSFVAEGITTSKTEWKKVIVNISSLLREGGVFIIAALREAKYWVNFDKKYPACAVNEMDLINTLTELGFKNPCVLLNRIEDPKDKRTDFYKGCFMIKAIK